MLFESNVNKPKRLALFRAPADTTGFECVGTETLEKNGWIRVSEYVEVTFQPISQDEVRQMMLASLSEKQEKVKEEHEKLMRRLDEARQDIEAQP
jgi:hypothetical protein